MSDPGTSYRTRCLHLYHLNLHLYLHLPLHLLHLLLHLLLPRDEVQEMRKTRDPITGFRERLIQSELAQTSEIKAIEIEVKLHPTSSPQPLLAQLLASGEARRGR